MNQPVAILLALVTVAIMAALLLGALGRRLAQGQTVYDHDLALRIVDGRMAGRAPPGRYRNLLPWRHQEIVAYDGRPTVLPLTGQEMLSADGAAVKLTMLATYRITSAEAAHQARLSRFPTAAYPDALYAALQVALREAVAALTLDEIIEKRAAIGAAVRDACAERLAAMGAALEAVELRDVMLSGELKQAYAQLLVARKQGQAALERARGETAALRSLSNAARLAADNPALLPMRALQAVAESKGNTFVLGLPGAVLPVGSGGGAQAAAPAGVPPAQD